MKINKYRFKKLIQEAIREGIDSDGNFVHDKNEDLFSYPDYEKPRAKKGWTVSDDSLETLKTNWSLPQDSEDPSVIFIARNSSVTKETLYIFDFDDCLIDSEGLMIVSVLAGVWDRKTIVKGKNAIKKGQPSIKKGGISGTSFPMRSREFTNLKQQNPGLFVWHNYKTGVYPASRIPYDTNNLIQMKSTAQTLSGFTDEQYKAAIETLKNKNPGYDEDPNYPIVKLSGKTGSLQSSFVSSSFYENFPLRTKGKRAIDTAFFSQKPSKYSTSQGSVEKDNRPIEPTLEKFEEAVNDRNGITAVVTARSPRAATAIPYIIDLFKKGLVHRYDVYGTGVSPSQAKGDVINALIKRHNNDGNNIKKVVVYEDSISNINEIKATVGSLNPGLAIECYHVIGFDPATNNTQSDPFGSVSYRIDKV